MKKRALRRPGPRLVGLAALLLFLVFMGNIVLAKAAMLGGFSTPHFSAQTEFLLLLFTTLLLVIFLTGEERRKKE